MRFTKALLCVFDWWVSDGAAETMRSTVKTVGRREDHWVLGDNVVGPRRQWGATETIWVPRRPFGVPRRLWGSAETMRGATAVGTYRMGGSETLLWWELLDEARRCTAGRIIGRAPCFLTWSLLGSCSAVSWEAIFSIRNPRHDNFLCLTSMNGVGDVHIGGRFLTVGVSFTGVEKRWVCVNYIRIAKIT